MSVLPPGWASASIDELGELRLGKMLDKAKNEGRPAKYLRNINVRWFRFDLEDLHIISVAEEEIKQFSVQNGDLFICEGGEPGRCAVWRAGENNLVYQKALHRFRGRGAMLPELLMYRLRHDAENGSLSEAFTGTTIKHLTRESLAQLIVPVPPIPEQQRIVGKLDAVLGRIDACRERLDNVLAIVKRLRQAVLAAATSGELTSEWRVERGILCDEYDRRVLGDLVREPLRNGKSVKDGDGPMVLRLSSLRNGTIDWREAKAGDWGDIDVTRFFVEDGDFLVARGNGSKDLVGRGSLVVGAPSLVAFPDTMIRIRPDPARIVPAFLKLVWDSAIVRQQIESSARTTAGIWKVSQPDLEAVSIPLPSLHEQEEIVRRADELLGLAESLSVRCESARTAVRRLTTSVLSKAFRGELVPQDPSDEPASELLARLSRRQPEAPPAPPRKRSRTSIKRSTMQATDKEVVRAAIRKLEADTFAFDDLRAQAAINYEALKDALFELLEEDPPVVRQVFDKKAKTMQLVRVRS